MVVLFGFLASELMRDRVADASSAPAPTKTVSPEQEMRERYQKRVDEIEKSKHSETTPVAEAEKKAEPDVDKLLESLKTRETELNRREELVRPAEQGIKDREAIIKEQLGKYEATLAKLRGEIKNLEKTREDKVDSFREVYAKMEPKKAARILDDMEASLASRILGGLKQQQAAEILGKMDPEKARRITKRFLTLDGQPSRSVSGDND